MGKSSEEWKHKAGKEARELIESWKPDLVYTNDDNAQEYVAKYFVNSDIPFVFSGVNADPQKYGFVGSRNNTGVLEQEHFVESVQLLREMVPNVHKIAVIFDEGSTWPGVMKRMKATLDKLPGIEFISWETIKTFEQFKSRMTLEYITVSPDGSFEFLYDVGDMFLGHLVEIDGILSEGLTTATIQG